MLPFRFLLLQDHIGGFCLISSQGCNDAEASHPAHARLRHLLSFNKERNSVRSRIYNLFWLVYLNVLTCACKVNAPRRQLTALTATWCSTSSSPITTPPPQSRLRSAPAESAVSEWAVEWPWTASTLHVGCSGGEASHHRRGPKNTFHFSHHNSWLEIFH